MTKATSTDVTYDAGPMKTDLLGNFKFDPTGTRRYNEFQQIFIPAISSVKRAPQNVNKERGIIEKTLIPEQRANAQAAARIWQPH